MPLGVGYWISPLGEIIEVGEHLTHVRDYPHVFGFSERDIKKFGRVTTRNLEKIRRAVLTEVMRRDWIRLRATNEWHFQYWRLDGWTLERIRTALRKLGAGDFDVATLSEVSTGRREPQVRVGDILGTQAESWVAGIGDVCCICSRGLVSGVGIGDIGPRPVCTRCDAYPLKGVAR